MKKICIESLMLVVIIVTVIGCLQNESYLTFIKYPCIINIGNEETTNVVCRIDM